MLRFGILTLALAALILPAEVAAKKPTGKISDLAAFTKVQSYCIDASDLADDEALDLRNFIITERGPKKLLSKLPWTYLSDCSKGDPDVVVRMKFDRFAPIGNRAPVDAAAEFFEFRAYLRIWQDSSSQPLYEVEAAPSNNDGANDPPAVQRREAILSAFWTLVEDVQRVSQSGSKR